MITTSSHAALAVPPGIGNGASFRLSDLLARRRDGGNTVFVSDSVLRCTSGGDPLLYTAHRDVLPPRQGLGSSWFADLVAYQPGVLSGGEPHRSTGHWNTSSQLEVFQTLTGRTLMITAWRTASGRQALRYQECPAGALAVIPFGGWHLTLVLDGPAAVVNFYTDLPTTEHPTAKRDADADKYRRAPAVEITAILTSDGYQLAGPGLAAWGPAQETTEPAWLRRALDGASLADFYRSADQSTLAALIRHARRHLPAHSPLYLETERR
ncbi:hypothetical protein AB0B10_25075 [Micromonospora arborensis]|uniref:hypothetical protein n=1 Tax=Micromonospora arborensis TaxID=2116518 RepID=UPI0033D6C311